MVVAAEAAKAASHQGSCQGRTCHCTFDMSTTHFFFKNVDELGIPAVLLALLGVGVAIVRRLATLAATVPAAAAAAAAATTRGVGLTGRGSTSAGRQVAGLEAELRHLVINYYL